MRRSDREITEISELLAVLEECKFLKIATQDEAGLYIVPLTFGYVYADEKLTLFVHSAQEGRKIAAFTNNPQVAFEMDCQTGLMKNDSPCQYSFQFKSIIGSGVITEVTDPAEKLELIRNIMHHQTGLDYSQADLPVDPFRGFRVDVAQFTGKQRLPA